MSRLLAEYRVYLTGVSGSDQIISTSATRRTTFTGLTAGTSYTVVVVTRSGDQQSDLLADTFYTSKSTLATVLNLNSTLFRIF